MQHPTMMFTHGMGIESLRLRHPLWYHAALGFALLTAVFSVLLVVDAREFQGVSTWTKPVKFALSLSVYYLTLAWFAPLMGAGYFATRKGRVLTWMALVCGLFEMLYITVQASMGLASHFNTGTVFHSVLYSLMGVGATALVTACLWMGIRILRRHGMADPYVFAVGVGLVLSFVLGGGFGGYLSSQGGHWVGGTPSDAAGTALFHWSTNGGDLRVAHFFGLHAMQIVPLLALPFARKRAGFGIAWVATAAAALAAFSLATFVQAINGLPFLS